MPKDIPKIEEPPQNQNFPKIIIIILVVFLAVTLTATGYFFSKYQALSQQVKTPKTTTAPAVTTKKTTAPAPVVIKGPSFQEILKNSCENISLEDLPVTIDESAISIQRLTCMGDNLPNTNFVIIEYGSHNYLYLYDKNSKEPGHGGPSFFGSLSLLKDDGQIKWSFIPGWNEVGCNKLDELGVTIRGERKLTLQSGETIFVNTDRTTIEPGDPRIVNLLKDNLEFSDCANDKVVKMEGAEEKIKQALFSNFTADENIQTILMAISPKSVTAVKSLSPQTKTLTESDAIKIAEKQIGACDCANRTATVTPSGTNVWAVTITDTGLMDDSVSAQQAIGTVTNQNGNYVWKTTNTLFRCAPGRGHQTFSTALCE